MTAIKDDNTVDILWYHGNKTGVWALWLQEKTSGKRRRGSDVEKVAVNENIEVAKVWSDGFQLTNTKKLPKEVKEAIKRYVS